MAKRSKVLGLPAEVKTWLDAALVENNFSQFEMLAAALKARGHEISKSALHRYGQPFQDRLATLKIATEQARAVVMATPDDDNAMNDSLIRLVQEKLFTVLVEMNVGGEDGLSVKQLGQVSKGIADVGRASVQQKKYQQTVRERVSEVAGEVESLRGAGASDDSIDRIKRRILGIAA